MMRTSLCVLALSLAAACSPAREKQPVQAKSTPPPAPIGCPPHGLDEDVECPYVFAPSAAGEFQHALKSEGEGKPCHLNGVQVAFTHAVVTWTAPGGQQVSLTISSECGAKAGTGEPSLVTSGGEEAMRLCPGSHAAVLQALREGRLPKPRRRPDQPLRISPPAPAP